MRLEFFDGVFTNMSSEAFQVSPRTGFVLLRLSSQHLADNSYFY